MAKLPRGISKDPKQSGYHTYVDIGVNPTTGKRQRKHVRGSTPAEVVHKRDELLAAAAAGQSPVGTEPLTFEQYATTWLTVIEARGLAYKTLVNYRTAVQAALPVLGKCRIDKGHPNTKDCELLSAALHERGVGNVTINTYFNKLSTMFSEMVKEGILAFNPKERMKLPPNRGVKKKRSLTPNEVQAVVAAIKGTDKELRVLVSLCMALRQGEIIGMKWSAIDWEKSTYRKEEKLERRKWEHGCDDPSNCGLHRKPLFRAAYCPQRMNGGLVYSEVKERREALLPISSALLPLFKAQRKRVVEMRLAAGEKWQENDLVFPGKNGRPVSPEQDRKQWGEVLVGVGLEYLGTHGARHTAISTALNGGIPLPVVSRSLAHHASTAMTEHYYHSVTDIEKTMAETMAKLIMGEQAM